MTLETMQKAVDELKRRGISADLDYPGHITVNHCDGPVILYGDNAGTFFAGDFYESSAHLERGEPFSGIMPDTTSEIPVDSDDWKAVADFIFSNTPEGNPPAWDEWQTGGECKAYGAQLKADFHVLITDVGGLAIPKNDETWMIGLYDPEGEQIGTSEGPRWKIERIMQQFIDGGHPQLTGMEEVRSRIAIAQQLNGTPIMRRDGIIFIRLPRELWRSCGRCECPHCKGGEGFWDTLAVDMLPDDPKKVIHDTAHTVHMPEFKI